ncbi:hypothetical protein HY091_01925 [Candidatus Kaiserbacteria bacterium]|nr:hypothetical protein [Candidatus Kaiserbacteria bacterium]
MKKAPESASKRFGSAGTLFIIGLILAAGSFLLASGTTSAGGNSLLASIFFPFFSSSTVTISRDASSPWGTLANDSHQTLAVFSVRATGVTHGATVSGVRAKINVSGTTYTHLSVGAFSASYRYCTTAGTIYGYGYPGGLCGIIWLPAFLARESDGVYTVSLDGSFPVYPNQQSGQLTILGTPHYTQAPSARGSVRATIESANATGDQCHTIHYGYKDRYGYSECAPATVSVGTWWASGNTLPVSIPYGYAYPRQ